MVLHGLSFLTSDSCRVIFAGVSKFRSKISRASYAKFGCSAVRTPEKARAKGHAWQAVLKIYTPASIPVQKAVLNRICVALHVSRAAILSVT